MLVVVVVGVIVGCVGMGGGGLVKFGFGLIDFWFSYFG